MVVWCCCCCCYWRADSKTSVLNEEVLRKRKCLAVSPNLCCPEICFGMNRKSHPDWVKICVDPNGRIKLRAKQKYEILSATEALVTQRSNPMVHRIIFASISLHEDEPIQQYLVRIRATATDSNFSCPRCEHDLSDIYINDQFIRGIANDALQAGVLKSLDQNVYHAEVFESALRDQTAINDTSDVATIRMLKRKTKLGGPTEVILALAPLLLATII